MASLTHIGLDDLANPIPLDIDISGSRPLGMQIWIGRRAIPNYQSGQQYIVECAGDHYDISEDGYDVIAGD